jgi:hypothetical protein
MANWLVVCEGCARHVKPEGACPFCGAEVAAGEGPTVLEARLHRAAMLGLGAAITLSVAACGAPPYGVAPFDASPQDASPQDANTQDAITQDQGGPAPMYGAAPVDGGS